MVSNIEESFGLNRKGRLIDFDISDALTTVKKGTKAGLRRVTPLSEQYLASPSRLARKRDAVEKKRQKSGNAHVIGTLDY